VTLEKRVADEWYHYYMGTSNNSKKQKISALMTCFCSQEFDNNGIGVTTQQYTNSLGEENAVCSEWFFDKSM
jgi:hypothetical protein